MSFAFAHLTTAWAFGKVFELTKQAKIHPHVWFFLLFGSLLPDADLLIDWIFNIHIHRTFSHSIVFAVAAGNAAAIIFAVLKHKKASQFGIALSMGIITHMIMDSFGFPGTPLLWPYPVHFALNYIGIPSLNSSLFQRPAAEVALFLKFAVIDMAIGSVWIFYLTIKKKIQF
jgi:membrane-bound metal-dependent hydrolase YbcI (DUF457 family)